MKKFLYSLILAAGILISAATTESKAQPCSWTFRSSIDCQVNFQLFLTCPPNAPVAVTTLETSTAGCWDTPSSRLFTVFQCNPPIGCSYSVTVTNSSGSYSAGDIICCDSNVPPEDCSTCNCAYIRIDPVTKTVYLEPATSGPGWDCNPPAAVQ